MNDLSQERCCTAGSNYFVIYQDGLVYRCWPYAGPGQEVLGSVADLALAPLIETHCLERKCLLPCDPSDVVIQEDGANQRGRFVVDDDDPRNPQRNNLYFQIMMNHSCNYACDYCIALSNTVSIADDKKKWLTPSQWVRWWNWIGTQAETVSVTIAGGEPTIFPGFKDIMVAISKLKGLNKLCTNLSVPSALEPVIKGEAPNWSISATAHPNNPSFNLVRFTQAAEQINKSCQSFRVMMVDVSENKKYLDEFRNLFQSKGIQFDVLEDQRANKEY